MNGLAAEALSQEYVPVRLEIRVHVLFNRLSNLDAFLFEIVLRHLLLGDRDQRLKHVVGHVRWPVDVSTLKCLSRLFFHVFSHIQFNLNFLEAL